MKSKKFVMSFAGLTGLLLIVNMIVNYSLDTYGVFGDNFNIERSVLTNERYAKMNYLLNRDKGKHDTFIFGSSRTWRFNPMRISDTTYNLGYSGGLPKEFLRDFKSLLAGNVKVKKLILTVDDFAYKRNIEEVGSNINWIGYDEGIGNFKYKMTILFNFPEKDIVKSALGMTKIPRNYYGVNEHGMLGRQPSLDYKIPTETRESIIKHINQEDFKKPKYYPEKNAHIDDVINDIKEINDICKKRDIELILVFNPAYIVSYKSNDLNNLYEYKYKLAQVHDYYDFSGVTQININSYYWGENLHFKELVANFILDVIAGKDNKEIPNDFYKLVNKGNAEYLLQQEFSKLRSFDYARHNQYIPGDGIDNNE